MFGSVIPRKEMAGPMLPPPSGLFGSKRRVMASRSLPAMNGADGVTLAHKGMPALRQGEAARQAPALPGPISGFGGGTFDLDGSQVTPVDSGGDGVPANGVPQQGGPLGGSMRQPFDYEAAKAILAGEKPKIKDWQKVAAIIGDALVQTTGGTPMAVRSILERQNDYSKRQFEAAKQILDWQQGDFTAQRDADLRAANPFTIGRDRVGYDPATGQSSVIYDGQEDFELYAAEMGLEPGSDDYFQAVEDFVLRSSGPSAHGRDVEMDDHRTANDRELETLRYGNRRGLEAMRQENRAGMVDYRNANPSPSRARSGSRSASLPVVTTPAEARALPSGTRFRTPDGRVKVRP